MTTFGDDGVRYFSELQGRWVTARRGTDISQAEYDAMPSHERYLVLAYFAD